MVASLGLASSAFGSSSASSFLAGVLLFVAHLYWIDPQIYTLAVNFQSIWLIIHVVVISASYGFLAICALLGIITLILLSIFKNKNPELQKSIKESFYINQISMILGLSLLVIGTLLGSVYANEVWGRIWGWDPKEAWSFISICVYMLCLHLRYIFSAYKVYVFSVISVISYASILMTYFGVNYFFDAIHVFASKSALEVPSYTYAVIAGLIILFILALKNRKYKC